MTRLFDRDWKSILTVLALAVLFVLPAYLFGSPANVDLSNHFRFALPFYEGLKSGEWYPSWNATVSGGYGDPSFRFYPPGLYYLLAAGRAASGSWYAAALIAYTLLAVIGGLGVYLWAREFLSRGGAVAAAALAIFAPYHVNQLYQAYLLAEFAGGAVLPFAFWFTARVCKRGDWRDVAGLGAAFAILVLTHLPLTVIGGIALAFYGLISIDRKRLMPTLLRLAIGAGSGLAASAFFWFPMLREMRWVGLNELNPDGSVVWYRNFLFSTLSPENLSVWWISILAILTFAFFAPALAAAWRAEPEGEDPRGVRASLWLALFALAMTTYLSWPVWRLSKTLQSVQFPWRFMGVVSLAGAVAAAAYLPYWLGRARGKQRPVVLLVGGAMLIALAFSVGQIMRGAAFLRPAEFNAKLADLERSPGLEYWWTIWTKPTVFSATERVTIPGRKVTVEEWSGERRRIQVNAGAPGELRAATLFYPLWQASINGAPAALGPGPDGAITITVPPQDATVVLTFVEPRHTKAANILSLFGWIGLVCLWVYGRSRARPKTMLRKD